MTTSLSFGPKMAHKVILAATACALLSGLGACSSLVSRDEPNTVASPGQRKAIVTFQQGVEPSRSLRGVGYYLPDPVAVTDWTQPAGTPGRLPEHIDAGRDLKVAWSRSIGSTGPKHAAVLAQPVSDGKLIYTLDGAARVSAFEVNGGRQVWSVNLNPHEKSEKNGFGGGLALSGGKLYVTSGYRFIAALDAASGAELWRKSVEAQFRSAPVATAGTVLAVDVENQVFAYTENGIQQWTYQAITEPARILRSSAPVIVGSNVIVPFSSGELVALRVGTGEEVWKQTLAQSRRTNALSQIRDISGAPVVSNGVVYAASHSGMFLALDVLNGTPRWQRPLTVDSVNTPWVAGDVVFLLDVNNTLIAANRESGQVYWVKELNGPITAKERSASWVPFGKSDKRVQWTGPVLAANRLLMVTSEGELVALNPQTGDELTKVNIGKAAYLTPIAVGNMLYVITEDAKLVAIR